MNNRLSGSPEFEIQLSVRCGIGPDGVGLGTGESAQTLSYSQQNVGATPR
jgi:hypothetical protein